MRAHDVHILRAACNFHTKYLLCHKYFLRDILAVPVGHMKYLHMLQLSFLYVDLHFTESWKLSPFHF